MKKEYKIGDFVYAKVRPTIILVVRQYVGKFYYCRIKDDPTENELVYFDSELRPYIANLSTTENKQVTL